MLLSSLNTGSTDLRDTEVQQPNTTATLSLVISSRAFSANSGQFEAGSTTTASSFLPSTPPFLFCSSMSMSITSFSVVSLMAMVPESECRMPTLIVSCAWPARSGVPRWQVPPRPSANGERAAAGGRTKWVEHRDVLCIDACDRPGAGSRCHDSQGPCQGDAVAQAIDSSGHSAAIPSFSNGRGAASHGEGFQLPMF